MKSIVENKPRLKATGIAKQLEVTSKTCVTYLQKLGYYERAARKKPFVQPINIKSKFLKIKNVYLFLLCLCIFHCEI